MKSFALLTAIALVAVVGCGTSTPIETVEVTPVTFTLCKDCGQVKGGDECCAEGAEICKCGFAHGSPACCKLEKTGEDLTLCAACGYAAGSEKCCAEGAEVCECGFVHGSPACCKIETDGDTAAHDEHEGHDHDGEDHDAGHDEEAGHDNDSDA